MDEKVVDLVPLAHCISCRYLGLYLLQQLISLKNRIRVRWLGHRPSYSGGCCVKDTLKMG